MTQNKDTKLSETRQKRKSQRDGITEDFLLFLNSPTKRFFTEDELNDICFIVSEYVKIFFDNIKLHLIKDRESDFKELKDLILKVPQYHNYTPLTSDLSGDCFYGGGLLEYIYWELLKIIVDVLSMLEQKRNYAQSEISKDIQKALNSVKKKAEKWLNMKLDHKKAEMLLKAYEFHQAEINDIDNEWYFEDGEEMERYFKIDLGYQKIIDEDGEIIDAETPIQRLTFQEITKIEIDDTSLDLIAPFLDFISQTEYAHKIVFKKKITDEEKAPINYFLYRLNDTFGLGIKKEINDGLFISLIVDGYLKLQERNQK